MQRARPASAWTSRCTRLVTQGIVNGPDGRKMSQALGQRRRARPHRAAVRRGHRRIYMLFAGPPERTSTGPTSRWRALFRFLKRVWRWLPRTAGLRRGAARHDGPVRGQGARDPPARRTSAVKRVTEAHRAAVQFNTAIAGAHGVRERALRARAAGDRPAEKAAMARGAPRCSRRCSTPFAPHVGGRAVARGARPPRASAARRQPWPAFDPALVVDDVRHRTRCR